MICLVWGSALIRAGYRGATGAFGAGLILVPGSMLVGALCGALGGALPLNEGLVIVALFGGCAIAAGMAWSRGLVIGFVASLIALVMMCVSVTSLSFSKDWLASAAADEEGALAFAEVTARAPRGFDAVRGPWWDDATRYSGARVAPIGFRDVGGRPVVTAVVVRRGAYRGDVIRLARDFHVTKRDSAVITNVAQELGVSVDRGLLVYRPLKRESGVLAARDTYRWASGFALAILGVVAALSSLPRRFGGARHRSRLRQYQRRFLRGPRRGGLLPAR